MVNKYYPNLASPITIKGVTFKNRIFGAPMSNPEMDPDCNMRKEEIAFHENRARGGLATAIGANDETNPDGLPVRSMTEEDIYRVADCFAKGAKLAKDAGFDMVLIHGGHGWLLGQFSSPTMNHRTDRWGGSLENRMRFPLLVIEKVREAVGPNYPIEFRMSGAEYIEGGYTIEEGVAQAKMLDGKVDIIHVSAGIHEDMINSY